MTKKKINRKQSPVKKEQVSDNTIIEQAATINPPPPSIKEPVNPVARETKVVNLNNINQTDKPTGTDPVTSTGEKPVTSSVNNGQQTSSSTVNEKPVDPREPTIEIVGRRPLTGKEQKAAGKKAVSEAKLLGKKIKVSPLRLAGIVGGILLVLLGFFLFYEYSKNIHNMILGIGGFVLVGGGGLLVYLMFQAGGGIFSVGESATKRAPLEEINALIISPDLVYFEQLAPKDVPTWQARKCRNNGKLYWIFKETITKDKLRVREKFVLPDTAYRDPREVANYLNIPAHRRLAQREASLFQKIAPGLIVVAMLVVGIIWIASTPNQQPTVAAAGNITIITTDNSGDGSTGGTLVAVPSTTTTTTTKTTHTTTTTPTIVTPTTKGGK